MTLQANWALAVTTDLWTRWVVVNINAVVINVTIATVSSSRCLLFLSCILQGVTLTDLQEAEKTIGRSRPMKTREEEKEEKEKQDKEKQEEKRETETKEDDYRSRYRSFEEVSHDTSAGSQSSISPTSILPILSISLALPNIVFRLRPFDFHTQHCVHPVLL